MYVYIYSYMHKCNFEFQWLSECAFTTYPIQINFFNTQASHYKKTKRLPSPKKLEHNICEQQHSNKASTMNICNSCFAYQFTIINIIFPA